MGQTILDPIREAAVAGMFYSGEADQLAHEVDAMLNGAPEMVLDGEVVGLICPHAGYPYSGAIAAAGYWQVCGESYDAVLVIGPSHRESFEGASVFARGGYETPLGVVPVDRELADAIVAHGKGDIQDGWIGHRLVNDPFRQGPIGEHALEVQLPFLQRTVKDLKIVPMVVGHHDLAMCQQIGDAIVDAMGERRVLIVVSSDLYHGEDDAACRASDTRTLGAIETMNFETFAQGVKERTLQACGSGPILIVMHMAKRLGVDGVRVVACTNSNEVTGRAGGYVVGYGAVVLVR